jgi:O-Antigen ligase
VLTYYKGTWTGLPLIVPIPSAVGKVMTQGSLPAGLLVAWSVNRRMLIRPNVFLSLLTLLFIEALIAGIHPVGHITGTLYRTFRLGEFVATLWLLSPLADRRDLLFVRCHLKALGVVLGSIVLGLLVSPHRALAQGRLSGEFWPITPVQVADFAAVALGLVVVLWFCGEASGRGALATAVVTGVILILTHTRTEIIALLAGLLVAGLSMFTARVRVRRLFASVAVTVSLVVIAFSSVLATWLARGENSQELTNLTGRTTVWGDVVNTPRDWFQVIFGFGLSNKASYGLPIDSNWLAGYQDLGLVGVSIIAAFVLFVLVSAYFQPRTERRALALFLVTYLLVMSYTETGLSDASMYLLELALAAYLVVPPAPDRSLL